MNSLFLIIQFWMLLMMGYFWYRVLRWTPEEGLAFGIVSMIMLILVAGFVGVIKYVLPITWLLSFAGMILFILGNRVLCFQSDTNTLVNVRLSFFTPGVFLLIVVFVYGLIAFQGLVLQNWDELHQWGKAVRYMLNYNALPRGDLFDGESVLLSTTTIFHYYFCKFPEFLSKEIIESNMYVSNLVLWFSGAILPLSGLDWKDWKRCFLFAATVFFSMNILFVQPYYNIYCDQPVTMWAGGLLIWHFFTPSKQNKRLFVVLTLFTISMFKNMMGPLFSAVIILAMLIQYIMETDDNVFSAIKTIIKKISAKDILYAVLCVCSIFLVSAIWSKFIGENSFIRGDGILKTEDDRLELTVISGLTKWFQPVNLSTSFPNLTFFLYLLLVLFFTIIITKHCLDGLQKKIYRTLMITYGIGFFAFFAVMIYAYLTTFSYSDSITTGSLNRYLSDYMLLGLLPIMYPFICLTSSNANALPSSGLSEKKLIPLLILAVSTTNNFTTNALTLGVRTSSTYTEINDFSKYKEQILNLMDSDEKIYMINQNKDGFYTVLADYKFELLLDRSGMCYYFTDTDQNIVGLSYLNIRMLPKVLLQDYGYLWIYQTDSYFDQYVFDVLKIDTPVAGDFYKVINENGRLKLQYLGNVLELMENEEEE